MSARFQLTIDGLPVEAAPGETILQVARRAGVRIPTLCHVEGFAPSASCFICAVKIAGRPNLWPSCAMPAAPGMVVETNSPEVREARKTALELLVSDHAGDCVGPCQTGCPARLRIPEFIAQIAVDNPAEAAAIVHDDLTLPASLGRVCPRLCEQRCRRCQAEAALSIRNLHRFAADQHRRAAGPYRPPHAASTGKRAAIVGAGPAGLAAADHLLRRGHAVVLFDAHPKPGGMLRYGIPAFRLPHEVLDAEIEALRARGAEFRLGRRLGRDFTLDELRREFDAVLLALGAQGSRALGCPGEELATPALAFLEQIVDGPPPRVGAEVLVVGGGNTAMDVSRSALRLGAQSVRVLYRRTRREMPCLLEEVEAAEEEGVRLEYLVAPMKLERLNGRLRLTCQRMALGAPDASGRARPEPVPGSDFVLEADTVIAAIGQEVVLRPEQAPALNLSKHGVAVDPKTLATNLPGVFAAGDAVTGPDVAVRAVAAGKLAAASMDQYLRGQPVVGALEAVNVLMGKLDETELAVLLRDIESLPRTPMPHAPLEVRRTSFAEVELGFSPEEARLESRRCLGCGCGKAVPCRLRALATEYGVDPTRFVGQRRRFQRDTSHPEIIFEPGKCILCGVCVEVARQASEDWGVAFYGRGFDTVVAPPLDRPMAEAFKKSGRRAAELCPTGALMLKGQGCAACRVMAGAGSLAGRPAVTT